MTGIHSTDIDLLEPLGGSGAEVHRGVLRVTGRVVVVKHAPWDSPAVCERLGREAAVLRRVQHASLLSLLEQVDDEHGRWLLLPHAPGGSLAAVITRGDGRPASEVADVGARIAAALSALHGAGVVHRDLHPGNVLLDAELQPVLADLDNALDSDGPALSGDDDIVGHPAHVDHRILAGRRADPRSDLHSLATTLWMLAVGTPPDRPSPGAPIDLPVDARVPRPLHTVLVDCVTGHADDAATVSTRLQELATRLTEPVSGVGRAVQGLSPQPPRVSQPSASAHGTSTRPLLVATTGGGTRRWGPRPHRAATPQPPPPTPQGRLRLLTVAGIVVTLFLLTVWWSRPSSLVADALPTPALPVCPGTATEVPGERVLADLDGDGCAEVLSLDDGVLHTAGGTYRLGEPGDVLLGGDWDGDGRWGLGLYRPATGAVYLIDEPGPGATSRPAARHTPHGAPVVVDAPTGHVVRVDRG